MKHRSCRGLYAYWTARRGERQVPDRSDIEPAAIRGLLADSFVLSGLLNGCRFRVAGTRICALFCRELRGEPFCSLWHADHAPLAKDALTAVTEEATGFVAGVETCCANGVAASLELLILPLSHRGVTGTRMLGILATFERPSWLGVAAAEPLRLGSLRYLPPNPSLATEEFRVPDPALLRRSFTVIHGGLD